MAALARTRDDSGSGEDAAEAVVGVAELLFNVFLDDGEPDEGVDFRQLMCGLSTLCGGARLDTMQAAFALYDYNNDGSITLEDMGAYLSAVFTVLFALQPSAADAVGVSPEQLAEATAEQAFEEAGLAADGQLSFEQFTAWYQTSQGGGALGSVGSEPPPAQEQQQQQQQQQEQQQESSQQQFGEDDDAAPMPLTLDEARRVTGLGAHKASDVFGLFMSAAHHDGWLMRDAFNACFRRVLNASGRPDGPRFEAVLDRLFDVFDSDSNGVVDATELMCGLSVLCGGSRHDKVRAAFALYDTNGDGFISLEEMTQYLASVFKVLYELQPNTEMTANVSATELAVVTAEHAFEEADLNHDGRLSFEEFSRWYAESEGADGVEEEVTEEGVDDEGKYSLLELRRLTNLETYTSDQVFEVFAEEADDDGLLSFEGVETCFQKLVAATQRETPRTRDTARTRAIVQRLYALFAAVGQEEEGGDGYDGAEDVSVDFTEFMCGLTVLCGGSPLDKIAAAFSLFDLEGDGRVALGDVERYLASVFAVLFQSTLVHAAKVTRDSGIGSGELAPIVAAQCFDECAIDHEGGRISAEEFYRWQTENERGGRGGADGGYSGGATGANWGSSSDDSDENGSSDGEFEESSEEEWQDKDSEEQEEEEEEEEKEEGVFEPPMRSLAEARALTKLGMFSVEDVFEIFEEVAVGGSIGRHCFDTCFDNVVKLAGGHTSMALMRRTRAAVQRLWQLFHTDGRGTVDFSELASGLSVLSGSSMDDKVLAAFNLFDVDGIGTISLDEFTCYISSVFRVLFEAQPHVAAGMSEVTADELAAVTARQCFADADLDEEGNLSFDQFKEWCLKMDV